MLSFKSAETRIFLFLMGFLYFNLFSFSQCVINNTITSPNSVCINQDFKISTEDYPGYKYSWDFCAGDFLQSPAINNQYSGSPITSPFHFELTYDNSNSYYRGFLPNGFAGNLLRLDFVNGLESAPIVTTVSMVSAPSFQDIRSIRIIKEGSNWYGVMADLHQAKLFRLNFGSSLTNNPTVDSFDVPSLNLAQDLIVLNEGSDYYVLVLNYGQNYITKIKFTGSISTPPALLPSVTIPVTGISISVKKVCSNWIGFVALNGSGSICRIDFGNTLANNANGTKVYPGFSGIIGVSFEEEAEGYYVFANTTDGNLYTLTFGFDPLADPISTSSPLSILSGTATAWGMGMFKDETTWHFFVSDYQNSKVSHFEFPNLCNASSKVNNSPSPGFISYSSSGARKTLLKVEDTNSNVWILSKNISVLSAIAPDIGFSSQNICANNNVNFSSQNISGDISSFDWKFGDGGTSTNSNPSHTYLSGSIYQVTLDVFSSNGCQNTDEQTLQIFNPPQASFNLPSTLPICSNQNYSFTNTTTFDAGSNPTWQWSVNGTNIATTQDLTYLIPTTAAQSVVLTASIPGCSSQSTQNISTVQDGPLVNFNSPANGCVNSLVTFTNASTGTITNFSWNFGDGNTSSQPDASNAFASAGNFPVTLTASNSAGCQNFLTQNFPVYSNPQPDFAIEAPPYSCANYPSQFDNNTPSLIDSNITSWVWSFGDAANGTSNQKNPTYTYSAATTYNVSLKATSNFGCNTTKQKSIIIYPSTQSGFTNTPACVDQNTIFTDASSGNITSYQWLIQGTTFSGAKPPPYVFKSAGTYPVSLTTTSPIGCKNQIIKNINVPVLPVIDFGYQPPCAGKPTTFQELNPGGTDPSVAWNWNFGSGSSVGSPVDYSFVAPGVYLVTLSATRNSGCTYSASKNVTIYNGPVAKFTPSAQSGAPPLAVTFNNESTADSYLWQFGISNSTSTEFSPTYTYNTLGEYKAILTAKNIHGCTDTISAKIYVVVPTVDLALRSFSLLENPNSNSSKPVVAISNLGNIPLTNPEIQIDLGGNAVLKEKITSTILPGKTIQQTLSLEIVTQNSGYICAEVVSDNDINIYNDRQCLSMTNNDVLFYPYPNPAKGQINFDWIASESESVAVTIFRSTGQVAFKQDFQVAQPGISQLAIDISSLSSGIYLVQFSGSKVKKTFSVSVIN